MLLRLIARKDLEKDFADSGGSNVRNLQATAWLGIFRCRIA